MTLRIEMISANNPGGFDSLQVNGGLTLNGLASNPIHIKFVSLSAAGSAGPVADFNPNNIYRWIIASASGGISNFQS